MTFTNLHYDPETKTIAGQLWVARVFDSAAEADPGIGDKLAAAPEMFEALTTIAEFPIPEQDDMIAANMRIIARRALAKATP